MNLRENRKIFLLLYLFGFFVGILYANTMLKDYITSMGIFHEYYLNTYMQTDINAKKYLIYLMRLRLMPFILIFVAGFTKLRKIVAIFVLIWTGFLMGITFSAAIIKMGMLGTAFVIISMFPQMILYIIAFTILLYRICNNQRVKWNLGKILVLIMIIWGGIILECYVNPLLIKMFLKTV